MISGGVVVMVGLRHQAGIRWWHGVEIRTSLQSTELLNTLDGPHAVASIRFQNAETAFTFVSINSFVG